MTEWQLIDDKTPTEIFHVRGLWAITMFGQALEWQSYFGVVNDETGEFVDYNGEDYGWLSENYTHWLPATDKRLPPPPPHIK